MLYKWLTGVGCFCCFYALCDFCRTFFGYRLTNHQGTSLVIVVAGVACIYIADSFKKEKRSKK